MLLKVRKSKTGEWGYLESYKVYSYCGKGTITALCAVSMEGELSKSYLFIKEGFVLPEDNPDISVKQYVKAKKPFYSKVNDGFIVELKASVDFNTGEFFPENSSYSVFKVYSAVDEDKLPIKRVLNVSPKFDELIEKPLRQLGESLGDRATFIQMRNK